MWDTIVTRLAGNFMPHGHCYLWTPSLVALEVGSNATIAVAYVAISVTLYYMVRRIGDVPFSWMYLSFGAFIIACGATHLCDVVTVWCPVYWLDAGIRVVTGVASLGTAILLVPLVPKAVATAADARLARARGAELEEAYRELARAHERTKEMERLRTRFFANVSHELRTPLALVLGPAERLVGSPHIGPEQRRDADFIVRNGRALLKQLNDLLDVAKLEAGKVRVAYSESDIARVLRETASNFEGIALERGITLTVDAPDALPAQFDEALVGRVVANLLSNAFKFTPAGGRIRCALRVDGEDAVLEVVDNGPGVPPADRESIFERFVQAEPASSAGGTGLGLAIVKELVMLHGGRAAVDDAPGGGAAFTVRLPLAAPQGVHVCGPVSAPPKSGRDVELVVQALRSRPMRLEAAPTPAEEAPGPLVLVAEDNADMNRFVCETLSADYRTAAAFDGRDAMQKAVALRPDLILSDVMMPVAGGEWLVEELRREGSLANVPVILLSANADEDLRVRMLRRGAQDYLVKPFSADELLARAANLVTMKRVRDVLAADNDSKARDLERIAREVTTRRRELSAALEAMSIAREHAERASRAKTDFLGMVSHELRTPLTAVGMQLHRLAATPGLGEPQRVLLARMRRSTGRLTDLVEALLEYAALQSGRLEVRAEDVDLGEIVAGVVDDARPVAEAKGLSLQLSVDGAPPRLPSDPRLLRLIVTNLVHNALKFTDRGGVDVTLSSTDRGPRLRVADTGPGIAPADQSRIFAPFVQLESAQRKHTPGVGLGLAIVRDLVSALGARLALESELGRGTAFTVELPPPS